MSLQSEFCSLTSVRYALTVYYRSFKYIFSIFDYSIVLQELSLSSTVVKKNLLLTLRNLPKVCSYAYTHDTLTGTWPENFSK